MKKLLLGGTVLLLMASCSGNGTSEKAQENAAHLADSIAQVEAAKAAAEQARQDSIRQDSLAKAEELAKAAQYDGLVSQFVSSVNKIEKAANRGDFSNMHALVNNYESLHNKINKVKNDLTPEQLTKVQNAEKKYKRLGRGTIAG